jgi:hypothetical protein
MKHILLSLSFLLTAAFSWAQCDPVFDFGDAEWGVAPDTITNLSDGTINSVYAQQIDVLVPETSAPFTDLIDVPVDSASIISVTGLPAGLGFECNSPLVTPCTYPGGSQGCGVITGIPTEAGVFELTISVMVYSEILDLPIFVEGYRIEISDPLSDGIEETATEFTLFPNPAQTSFELNFEYQHSEDVQITVFDIVGKEAISLTKRAQPGNNEFIVPVESLREGTYIVRLEGMNLSATKRLVVNK